MQYLSPHGCDRPSSGRAADLVGWQSPKSLHPLTLESSEGEGVTLLPKGRFPPAKLKSGDPKESSVGALWEVPAAPYMTPMPPRPDSQGPCQPGLPGLGRGQACHSGSRPPRQHPRGQRPRPQGHPARDPVGPSSRERRAGGARRRAPIGWSRRPSGPRSPTIGGGGRSSRSPNEWGSRKQEVSLR